ncbi:dipeptide/oligopeptide/nickel ABC transporter permease/ATP-binding protein [Dactylosporangium sp. CA-233914]|uniref:dipeptide/oligopeptide/nickel ABC transporter permease/ATP-binding protein n=1 Tax=Dactylosporangium sp. CA-233914 TaxID=3239934 RepID=UPI003D8D4E56
MMRSKWLRIARTPVGASAVVLLVVVLGLAALAPIVWGGRAAAVDTAAIQQGPSAAHWLGTDALGRDLFYRLLVATRLSVILALLATIIGVVTGTLLGTAPSVLPTRIGRLVTAAVDIAVAFPGLLLALSFAVIFGTGTTGSVFAIGLAFAPQFARLTYTLSAGVAGRDFVAAARVVGVGRVRILLRHILPNIAEPLVVNTTLGAGSALLVFAGLSFLGIGVQPPQYDWGRLLGENLDRIYTEPIVAIAPGIAVVIAGLAFNLLGEAAASVLGMRMPTPRRGAPPVASAREDIPDDAAAEAVLAVWNLQVAFPGRTGWVTPVRGVSFAIAPGEAVGLVGESGSGKSMTALAVARLLAEPGVVTADRLTFAGEDLLGAPERRVRRLLGTSLAVVFQDPMTSFNPTQRIGRQLAEIAIEHQGLGRRAALARAVDRLRSVRIPAAQRRAHQYPHELSGGMRQRAMIGLGLMGTPRLVIADEPTTALDVTVQRQVLRLLARVRADTTAAILLISHDITVVEQTCERVMVMYAGRVVETLPTADLRTKAAHPYTRALLAAVPDMDTDLDRPLAVIPGRPPELDQLPAGCAFAARCERADDRCRASDPALIELGGKHRIACWHPVAQHPAGPDLATDAAEERV